MGNIIKIEGLFSRDIALDWKEKLNELAKSNSVLELDLTAVTEADITGVNALATTQKILSETNKSLKVLVKKNSELATLLGYTKLDSHLDIKFEN